MTPSLQATSQNAHPARPRRRAAFTLIELLIVIAIIGILLALVVGGLHLSLKFVAEHQTRAILGDLNAMIAEAELTKPLPDLLAEPTLNNRPELAPLFPSGYPADYTKLTHDSSALDPTDTAKPVHAPSTNGTVVNSYSYSLSSQIVIQPTRPVDPLLFTAYALYQLTTIPKNRELLAKMPSNRFKLVTFNPTQPNGSIPTFPLVYSGAGTTSVSTTPVMFPQNLPSYNASVPFQLPVPIDAWGHYIYLIPGGGIYNDVNGANGPSSAGGLPLGLCSSVKNSSDPNAINGYTVNAAPVLAPAGKAFFVSAGPDGDLLLGDDNLYSFSP